MLKIPAETREYFKEVEKYALTRPYGVRSNFYYILDYLQEFGGRDENGLQIYDAILYPDHAPYSFCFRIVRSRVTEEQRARGWYVGEEILNGGVIYYRPGDVGGDAPQYSVRIGGDDKEEWRINT